ncbi:MAG: sugar transporter [Acidobacteria bacterium]|nr:MAG: sugar transporter [Acidobacteriota bacterium]
MFERIQFWVVLILLSLAIPIGAQESATKPQANDAPATSGAVKKPATADPNYVIGSEDVLDVSVWKEPDLSRTVPVRPDGKISLPLLNDVQAAGLTPLQLAAAITTSLNKFVTNPQVTVIISQINSQRFYLLGEVTRPGAYSLIPGMTVLQALSNAGGFTPYANSKKIYLLREENGKQQKLSFNYKDVIAGKRTEQNIVLKTGDTIIVP